MAKEQIISSVEFCTVVAVSCWNFSKRSEPPSKGAKFNVMTIGPGLQGVCRVSDPGEVLRCSVAGTLRGYLARVEADYCDVTVKFGP